MKNKIIEAILKLNPTAQVSVSGEDINTIVWENGTTPIPANEILAKQQELITEYNSNQYQRDRAKDYPSIQEQLDMQYWDKVNNTNNWQTKVNEIKVKYPKP
jgi:hypothetical protein